jgi:hypothetical protein
MLAAVTLTLGLSTDRNPAVRVSCLGAPTGEVKQLPFVKPGTPAGQAARQEEVGVAPAPKTQCPAEVVLEQLIARITQGSILLQARNWALRELAEPAQDALLGVRTIDKLPEFIKNMDPRQRAPWAVVLTETNSFGPGVVLMWTNTPGGGYGLVLRQSDSLPAAPPFLFKRLGPGAFAFFWDADRQPTVQVPTAGVTTNGGRAMMEMLIARLSDGGKVALLQSWATQLLSHDKPFPEREEVPGGPAFPDLLGQVDQRHGLPSVIVTKERSSWGPSVRLVWTQGASDAWGLLLASTNFEPSAPSFEFRKLQPGVFAFFRKQAGE